MFTSASLLTVLVVFFARVCDVSLATIRHVMIIRGRKLYAFGIAFVESLIWIVAVSRVLTKVNDPTTILAFALGFAVGTYTGMCMEGLFKIGDQVVRVFTRKGDAITEKLRDMGYRVTVIDAKGRDGHVNLLFVQIRRRDSSKIAAVAKELDPACFIVLDDIRSVHPAA